MEFLLATASGQGPVPTDESLVGSPLAIDCGLARRPSRLFADRRPRSLLRRVPQAYFSLSN